MTSPRFAAAALAAHAVNAVRVGALDGEVAVVDVAAVQVQWWRRVYTVG